MSKKRVRHIWRASLVRNIQKCENCRAERRKVDGKTYCEKSDLELFGFDIGVQREERSPNEQEAKVMSEMKLSQAIREGAKLRPQSFNNWFEDLPSGECLTCALGAAHEHLFGLPPRSPLMVRPAGRLLNDCYPFLSEIALHPLTGINEIENIIGQLNDRHKLSREQIADWLEEKGF